MLISAIFLTGCSHTEEIQNPSSTETSTSPSASIESIKGGNLEIPQVLKVSPEMLKDPTQVTITLENDLAFTTSLYPKAAPKTVENFLNKFSSGYYNNLKFHRVEDWVVQGGDPLGTGTGGGDIQTELNNLSFKKGAVGVARAGDIRQSNDSQFFIVTTDSTFLDKQYTNFGQVTKGMEDVVKIQIGDKIKSVTIE